MKTIIYGLFAIAASMIVPAYDEGGVHASDKYATDSNSVTLVAMVQEARE